MKRICFVVLIGALFASFNSAYAFKSELLDARKDIFKKSKEIKYLLKDSKDKILLNSLFDTCIVTIVQLDAYFSMAAIVNTIDEKNLDKAAVKYLIIWLKEIKKTNTLNIKNLNTITKLREPKTVGYITHLTKYFTALNASIDSELARLTKLSSLLKIDKTVLPKSK